jgi:hypothetical protein
MYDHLVRAYGLEVQMIDDWSEAVIPDGHKIVLLDQNAATSLDKFVHPEKAVYVVGKSGMDIHAMIPHDCSNEECVIIPTPVNISLFGVVASGIVLHHRSAQWLS